MRMNVCNRRVSRKEWARPKANVNFETVEIHLSEGKNVGNNKLLEGALV